MKKQSDGDVVDESGAGGGLRFGIVATVGVCYATFTLGIVAYIYRDHVRCFLMRRTRGMYPIPDTPLGFFRAPDPVDVQRTRGNFSKLPTYEQTRKLVYYICA